VHRGPAVTKYEVYPDMGVKVSKIVGLSDDLALALAAKDIRIEAPIPGKSAVGIEVPNSEVSMVTLREVLDSKANNHPEEKLLI
ncbi:DNA translocase FtsK, partial [Escherichia coli]|nr:DNA translocase FtsK [Escherichia coli]